MKKSLGAKVVACTTPVWVIGSYDESGKANAMAASWAGVCCSKPPCVCVALRKATHSYGSIMKRRAFTVSIPSQAHIRQADYLGIASGKDADKFAASGLTPVRSELVDAPYVQEFPVVLECRLLHMLEIGLHTQFIGEILDVKAEEDVLGSNGLPDIEKVKPFLFVPERDDYFSIGEPVGEAFAIGRKL